MNVRNILAALMGSVVAGIVVSCGGGGGTEAPTSFTVSGNVTRTAAPVTLKLNGGGDIQMAAAGPFAFAGALANGSAFNVQVIAPNQKCSVANGAGVRTANVTNVAVDCVAQTTQVIVQTARLTGAQEVVPPVAATGTGVGGVIVDPADKSITGGITFSGLTGPPTDASIYRAAPGADSTTPIITLVLATDNASATIPADRVLNDLTDLLAGNLYFNVKTANNPNGEIRGQINVQGGVSAGLRVMNAAQQVTPPSNSTATGKGMLLVDSASGVILISYMTHNVANATSAEIHTSPGPFGHGTVGDPIVNFIPKTGIAYAPAGALMTPNNMLDFGADYLYFSIRSPAHPDGDIRGDISRFQ
jgi:hypothetical protein